MSLTTIEDLNDDCLMQIFSLLTVEDRMSTEEVCRRWKNISKLGWPNVTFLRVERLFFGEWGRETILKRCGRFLKSLTIQLLRDNLHFHLISMVSDNCSQLETIDLFFKGSLDLDLLKYYREQLIRAFSKLQQLRSVNLRVESGDNVDDTYLSTLCVQNLQHLYINNILSRGQFSVNVSRFTELRSLHLEHRITTVEFGTNLEQLQRLTSLHLKIFSVSGDLLSKIPLLLNLKSLKLDSIDEICDYHISAIVRSCTGLTDLSLLRLRRLTDNCFNGIVQLPKLQVLEIMLGPWITDRHIVNMLQIHTLRWTDCLGTQYEGVRQLIKHSSNLCLLRYWNPYTMDPITVIEGVNKAIVDRDTREQFTLEIFALDLDLEQLTLTPSLTLKCFDIYDDD